MYLINAVPYVCFVLFFFFLSFPLVSSRKRASLILVRNYKILQYFSLTFLFLFFIGLRGYIWTDFALYKECFDLLPTIDSSRYEYSIFFTSKFKTWEKGYLLYTFLLKSIFRNYFVCQFVSTIINFSIMLYVFKRNCRNNVFLCFVIFFLFSGFFILINLQRNVVSILLFWLSIEQKREGKNLNYYVLNILGISFHSSSFLFLIIGPVINRRISKKFLFTLFILGNCIYLLEVQWLRVFLPTITFVLPSGIRHYIELYLNSVIFSRSGNWGISIGYLERFFSFLIILFFSDKIDKKYNCRAYINCFFLFIFAYLYGSEIVIVIERVSLFFTCGYCIVYTHIFSLLNQEKKCFFIIIMFFYIILKITLIGGANGATKYETCFSSTSYEEATIRKETYMLEEHNKILEN